MAMARPGARAHAVRGDGSIFSGLLRGYVFTVCEDPAAATRALEVRRRVYNEACGYDVPIPDSYDRRSWLLLAEDAASGEAVGSLRVTPRWAGPLEAEEYFALPSEFLTTRIIEVTRFSVLPRRSDARRVLPAVALGLLKLSARFVGLLGAERVVICSRLDRVQVYGWLGFRETGQVAAYRKLSNIEHALMICDLGALDRRHERGQWKFFVESPHGEIVLPARVPRLGLGGTLVRPARRPPLPAVNRRTPSSRPQELQFLTSSQRNLKNSAV